MTRLSIEQKNGFMCVASRDQQKAMRVISQMIRHSCYHPKTTHILGISIIYINKSISERSEEDTVWIVNFKFNFERKSYNPPKNHLGCGQGYNNDNRGGAGGCNRPQANY